MTLTLQPKSQDLVPVEAEVLTPDGLVEKNLDEIRDLKIFHGNRATTLGACFEISGDPSDGVLELVGDFSRVKQIGQSMTSGRITVRGGAGMHLGAEMRGGTIEVHGNAGDWVGAEMRGGLIRVRGDAGHLVGGSYRGSRSGMKGGVILVDGRAGNEVGCGMRRGLIAVGGDVADFAGFNLIAGTIVVCGAFGIRCGAGMRRGSILALGDASQRPVLLPTFRHDCVYEPQFLSIYVRRLAELGLPLAPDAASGSFHRYSGDLVALGKGEVLVRAE
jgi:formylmethanofuran dehydrogenase subunit C